MPTLIIIDSHIGYGAPHKHDTSGAHGEPLGVEEIRLAKRNYGWPEDDHPEVEAIEERPRHVPGVASAGRIAAPTPAHRASFAAWTRVHRRDQQEAGGELDAVECATDADDALLQRLAELVEHRLVETRRAHP